MNSVESEILRSLPKAIRVLAEKAASGSVEHLKSLSSKAREYQVHGVAILPVLYIHLDPVHIPKQITPESSRDLILAKWSFISIVNFCSVRFTMNGSEPGDPLFASVTSNWTRLYPWIPFFYRNFLADLASARSRSNSPVSLSEAAKITVGFMATLCEGSPKARSLLIATTAIRTTIMQLWITVADMENDDVDADRPSEPPARALSHLRVSMGLVIAFCLTSSAAGPTLPEFLAAAGGTSVVVATTLRHLRLLSKEVRELKEPSTPAESFQKFGSCLTFSSSFSQTVQIMLTLSQEYDAAREEFISRGSVYTVATALAQLRPQILSELPGDRDNPRTGITPRRETLYIGYRYIQHTMLESDDGKASICEAFRTRLLETILQTGHTEYERIPRQKREADVDVGLLIRLPHLLMHKRVLHIAARSLSRIQSRNIEVHARRDRVLWKYWDAFKEAINRYLRAEERLESIERPIYEFTCGGDQAGQKCISREETDVELYRCSGCLTVKYCSKHCQRSDWMKRHRIQCRIIRLAIGPLGSRDIRRNLLMIASIEAEERIPEGMPLQRFLDDARRSNPDYRGDVIAELDMSVYPMIHSVQPIYRYRNIFIKDPTYADLFRQIRSASSNIYKVVKLQQGNTVHYLLSPSTVLDVVFGWPQFEGVD
ncbi:hypothetical protein BV22DRAFT_402407 [Leucogyrophana mollusca]|uniref:Uncharacterized protein n=1 Tax=Leucogyrophana mollusca TaxID=85980 RepID=A0ACB8BK89_9AGAM|nr:hypothetical protein BV22DRAFT_402407 [Leucogyrophana mollusca]